MSTMETDGLVDDYLRRLDEAAAHMQRSRRAELVAEIREHIDAALREEEARSEAAVRNVLERLGPPEEIVDAAEPPPPDAPASAGKLEIGALIALLIPFVGWLVGMVLVVVSRAWSSRDKAVAATLVLLPVVVPFLGLMVSGPESGMDEAVPPGDDTPVGVEETDAGLGPFEVAVLAFLFLAGLPSALYLGWRLRHPGPTFAR